MNRHYSTRGFDEFTIKADLSQLEGIDRTWSRVCCHETRPKATGIKRELVQLQTDYEALACYFDEMRKRWEKPYAKRAFWHWLVGSGLSEDSILNGAEEMFRYAAEYRELASTLQEQEAE